MIEVKRLKAGDKVRRIHEGVHPYHFTVGKEYEVKSFPGGLFVYDDVRTRYNSDYLEANANYWAHVEPSKEEVGYVRIVNTTWDVFEPTEVTVHVNAKGLATIKALEEKSFKEEEARGLDAQIAQLEGKLKALKAERETMN